MFKMRQLLEAFWDAQRIKPHCRKNLYILILDFNIGNPMLFFFFFVMSMTGPRHSENKVCSQCASLSLINNIPPNNHTECYSNSELSFSVGLEISPHSAMEIFPQISLSSCTKSQCFKVCPARLLAGRA